VGLPDWMAVGRGNDEVGIIGGGEVDEFLPFRFVGIERDEAAELLSGEITTAIGGVLAPPVLGFHANSARIAVCACLPECVP